ncbi:MAG: MGMT family protein [Microcoleaceae cyanobacterium]
MILSLVKVKLEVTRTQQHKLTQANPQRMSTYDKIYEIVRQIPAGKVATYGQVADLANLYGKARLVGYALYQVAPEDLDTPWQRVVNAKGEVSHSTVRQGSDYLQRSLLEQEGIKFNTENKIDLDQYRWHPPIPKVSEEE